MTRDQLIEALTRQPENFECVDSAHRPIERVTMIYPEKAGGAYRIVVAHAAYETEGTKPNGG